MSKFNNKQLRVNVAETDIEVNVPRGTELSNLEIASKRYMLANRNIDITNTGGIPTRRDITSSLFEYDISGARVKSIGQSTGGYLREVAENEAAFSNMLQDAVGLYLLNTLANEGMSKSLRELDEIIVNSKGWMRVVQLYKGGLIDYVGSEIRITDRGLRELSLIKTHCQAHEQKDVSI
jgi:hypothetical protein